MLFIDMVEVLDDYQMEKMDGGKKYVKDRVQKKTEKERRSGQGTV
jgi:hypothetical protein